MKTITHCPEATTVELTVAECIERVLFDSGILVVPTIPGGPAMPLLRAIHQAGRLEPVLARHESGAALMAEGYFRVARKPAAVVLTAGPGVTNATTGVTLAFVEQSPMIVISAQIASSWQGRAAAQELDTVTLLSSVTKQSIALVDASRTQATLEHLIRVATCGRGGPVHLSVASDLWNQTTTYRQPRRMERVQASSPSTERLWELLCEAANPCVLVGRGASLAGAESQLLRLADAFPRLRFACSPRAKGTFPEEHVQSLGVFGFAGHAGAERALLDECDLAVILGSRMGEITSLGWDERMLQHRVAQVDIEPSELGRNFPIDLGLVGDIGATLEDLLRRGTGPSLRPGIGEPSRVCSPEEPPAAALLHPRVLMQRLSSALTGAEHVFVDIGNCMAWATHYVHPKRSAHWHVNLMYGCMGHALPAAIGGTLADGGQPTVVIVGDAAFAMTGQELHVAVERGLRIVVIVLNDSGHGMVEMGSEWQWGPGAVPDARFKRRLSAAGIAREVGALGLEITRSEGLDEALAQALGATGPVLLDCHIDPDQVPPFGARMDLLKKNFTAQEGSAA